MLTRRGWDAAGQGLVGAPPVTVVVGAEVHTTARKALGLVGLGRDCAIVMPADSQGRIDPRDLPELADPAIVCLQAGNVNNGASDPFVPLIEWAGRYQAWVHVDGAFGLWAGASTAASAQVALMERADSWATDCHKWLNTTYDCGLALVSDPAALRRAMEATASYLPGSEAEASVIAAVQDDGTCWCGPTTWQGHRAMRVSVSGWSTTEDDIDRSVAAVRACAAEPA